MKASVLVLAVSLIALIAAANFAQEPEPAALELALQPDRPGNNSPDPENDRGNGFSPQQMRQLQQMFRRAMSGPRPEDRGPGPGPDGPPRGPGPDGPPRGPDGPRTGEHEREVHYHYHYYHRGQHEEHHTEHHDSHRSVHYHYHYHYN
ncbi:MAG: hypothetical protein U0836_25555 [Pirellulales bacterium]